MEAPHFLESLLCCFDQKPGTLQSWVSSQENLLATFLTANAGKEVSKTGNATGCSAQSNLGTASISHGVSSCRECSWPINVQASQRSNASEMRGMLYGYKRLGNSSTFTPKAGVRSTIRLYNKAHRIKIPSFNFLSTWARQCFLKHQQKQTHWQIQTCSNIFKATSLFSHHASSLGVRFFEPSRGWSSHRVRRCVLVVGYGWIVMDGLFLVSPHQTSFRRFSWLFLTFDALNQS